MRKNVWLAMLVVGLVTNVVYAAEWKEFRSKEGAFSVLMPGTPTEGKQNVSTAIGEIVLHMYGFEASKELAYIVMYSDYPADIIEKADPSKMLDGARDGAVKNVKGKLRGEQKISIDKSPGREIVIETPEGALIKSRMYMVKNRLYQVMAVTAKGKESSTSKDTTKFLDSFKLAK